MRNLPRRHRELSPLLGVPARLDPWAVLAGPYPTSDDARHLADTGITLFVDLTEEGEGRSYAHVVKQHQRFPIIDHEIGTEEVVAAALDAIDAELADGGCAYVHCRWGCGRTGLVLACWLRRRGFPAEAALARIARLRGRDCPETTAQRRFVHGWRPGA